MNLETISSIGRPLDLSYKTNAFIAILSLATLVLIVVYALAELDRSWVDAILTGGGAAVAVFLCWSLARELDPDHDYAAFWGCALLIGAMFYRNIFHAHFVLTALILLQTRMLARTTGRPAKLFDSSLIFIVVLWLSFSYSWIVGMLAALVYWLDYILPASCERHKYFAPASFAVGIGAFLFIPRFPSGEFFFTPEIILLGVILVTFVPVIFTTSHLQSKADLTGESLGVRRVRAAQLFAAFSLAFIAVWEGTGGFYDLMPLWAAMTGIFIHRLFIITRKKPAYDPDRQTERKGN